MNKPQIKSGSLILTENCNLNCKYCFENNQRNSSLVMSKEVAEKAIDLMIKGAKETNSNNIYVDFFGGEPLLNFPVLKHTFNYAADRCQHENLKFEALIITNATIYNDEYEQFLIDWYNRLGYVNVQLSVDGIPEVQNEYRITANGGPSSHMVESVIRKCLALKYEKGLTKARFHVHGVVNKKTIAKMYESYLYFRKLGFAGAWFMPCHEEDWDDNDVLIFEEQLRLISNYIFDECVDTKNLDAFKTYASLAKCKAMRPDAPCSAGKTYATFTTNGDIYPCHNIYFNDRSTKIGDVFNGVDDSKRQIYLDCTFKDVKGDKPCTECDNTSCYVCIASNYVHNGNLYTGFPKYCKMSRMEDKIRHELVTKLVSIGLMQDPFALKSCNNNSCNVNYKNNDKQNNANLDDSKSILKNIEDNLKTLNNIADKNFERKEKLDLLFDSITTLTRTLIMACNDILKEDL